MRDFFCYLLWEVLLLSFCYGFFRKRRFKKSVIWEWEEEFVTNSVTGFFPLIFCILLSFLLCDFSEILFFFLLVILLRFCYIHFPCRKFGFGILECMVYVLLLCFFFLDLLFWICSAIVWLGFLLVEGFGTELVWVEVYDFGVTCMYVCMCGCFKRNCVELLVLNR